MLEVERLCFNQFPDQCNGCPEYRESHQDQTPHLILLGGLGFAYPPHYGKAVKECVLYHKRVVEFRKQEKLSYP